MGMVGQRAGGQAESGEVWSRRAERPARRRREAPRVGAPGESPVRSAAGTEPRHLRVVRAGERRALYAVGGEGRRGGAVAVRPRSGPARVPARPAAVPARAAVPPPVVRAGGMRADDSRADRGRSATGRGALRAVGARGGVGVVRVAAGAPVVPARGYAGQGPAREVAAREPVIRRAAARRGAAAVAGPSGVRLTRRGRFVLQLAVVAVASVAFAGVAVASKASPGVWATRGDRAVVVHEGDTLWSIAARHVPGADTRAAVDAIQQLNGLRDAHIVVGQQLVLPSR